MHTIKEAVVLGAGNWGCILAELMARNVPVRLWTLNNPLRDELKDAWKRRGRPSANKGFPLVIETKFASSFDQDKTLLVIAVPSSAVRSVAEEVSRSYDRPLVLCVSKGFDAEEFCTPSELIRKELPGACVVSLTGPTIANEIGQGLPTVGVLSSDDLACLAMVKAALRNDIIRFATGRNPTHHELCAALKGIIGIGVGMAEGLGLGVNCQAVIMTEGIAEMAHVASFFDIPREVVYGLSGVGDVLTTCMSPDSRNRKLGVLLGKGRKLQEALDEVHMTVEGVAMSRTIETLWALDVSIPLINFVNSAIFGQVGDLRAGFTSLLMRNIIEA
jgi:glycerol-3-phosphate dehydrogenase (NAD(P)+)